MDTLWQDVRYAARTLSKAPGFAVVVVLTLGLGIGANTAIFSLMDQVLLRLLPVRNPEELVLLDGPGPFRGKVFNEQTLSYPMYRDFRDRSQVFAGVLARFPTNLTLTDAGHAERVAADLVSGNYFDVLGVRPLIGRTFTQGDDRTPGGHPVVVLSHAFWKGHFASDPAVLNRTILLNEHPMTIVGVTPPGFRGIEVGAASDVMVPLMMKAQMTPTWDELEDRRSRWLTVLARLKPNVSREQAEAAANVLYRQINEDEVKNITRASDTFRARFVSKHLFLRPGQKGRSDLRQRFTTPLIVLMAMVGLVLLIACANVANLLIARAAARQKEVAIRLALGAGRSRIVRQQLVEGLVLAMAGGGVGLVFAWWTGDVLLRNLPVQEAAQTLSARPDMRIGGFTFAVAILTALVFGSVPALQSVRPALMTSLKEDAGSVAGGIRHVRFRKTLVIAQVALSVLLLAGAGLFARSLYNLKNLNPGFDAGNLLTFSIEPSLSGYGQDRIRALFQDLQDQLGAVPGVRSVSMAEVGPMTGYSMSMTVQVQGYQAKEGEDLNPQANGVGPRYFATLGMPLVAGREFTVKDGPDAPKVAVVNERMVRYFFGSENPLGRRFGFGRGTPNDIEIVGVVKDAKSSTLRDDIERAVFFPYMQERSLAQITFYLRTDPQAPIVDAVRNTVGRIDPSLPLFDVKTMTAQVDESLFIERIVAGLSAAFGALATLLAAIGLYGMMSYMVARRTREIGIRMALGAERAAVLWLVLREVAFMAAVGVGVGLPAAYAVSRFVQSQLFALSAADPVTLGTVTGVLAIVSLLAGYVPARRATLVDPMLALRTE